MPKIIVKTCDPSVPATLEYGKKPGYYVISLSENETPEEYLQKDTEKEIHAVLIDAELLDPGKVQLYKQLAGDNMFPVVLLCHSLNDEEAGRWVGCGLSDLFRLPMPGALMGKRLANVIQLYCITRSLHGQVTDNLTGLYNRNAFFHFAADMIKRDPDDKYTIILSDIDDFKRINERYGEAKGDALLAFVGRILGSMNNYDILFARYGGDQFVGIMRQQDPAVEVDPALMAEQMARFYTDAPVDQFEVKFGVYEDVDKTQPISIMCDRARAALKTIKHQYGRNYARYTEQLRKKETVEQQILDSMEEALETHQIKVYYQPKHRTDNSKLIGAEALVRWNHPVYGFMSPGDFIPLFERSGFISKMDEYVWNQVCQDMKSMIDKGMKVVPVSVNLSRKDLAGDNIVEKIMKPVKELDLDTSLLHVELTESVYMDDARILAVPIEKLRKAGIKIEMDDFGSGFSSLGIISKLPVDIIKLDIGLVREMEEHPVIVRSIIEMMHALGYKVTAEGIENDRQVDLLRKMQCDYMQGYYYSKPLTFGGFLEYMNMA